MGRPHGEHIKSQRVPDFKGLPEQLQPKLTKKIRLYNLVKKLGKCTYSDLYDKLQLDEGTLRRYVREMVVKKVFESKECECKHHKMIWVKGFEKGTSS